MPFDFARRFRNDDDGAVAIIFGFMFTALLLFSSLALDMARMLHVEQRVQASLDAASLAAAKRFEEPGITDAEIKTTAKTYFDLNIAGQIHNAKLTNFQATPNKLAGTVQATVDVEVPMMLAPAGKAVKKLNFKPSATTTYNQTKLEVALVLDITGSMNDPGPDGVRKIDSLKIAAKDFIDSIYATNTRPGFVRVGLVPYASSVNAGSYANTVAGFSFDNCVIERNGSNAYTDAAPSFANRIGRGNTGINPYYFCPVSTIVPLTDLKDDGPRNGFKANIDALQPGGGTAGHIGAAWGWYLVSNAWSGVWGANAGAPESPSVRKIVLLLTDGQFNLAYNNGGAALGYPDAFNPAVPGSSGYQALKLCNNMLQPSTGVTIYTIGFATPPEAAALLKSCSGEANYFDASDSNKLLTSFRNIASKLVSLRLSS
jgi:Flp pilus assembly protein TadG